MNINELKERASKPLKGTTIFEGAEIHEARANLQEHINATFFPLLEALEGVIKNVH